MPPKKASSGTSKKTEAKKKEKIIEVRMKKMFILHNCIKFEIFFFWVSG